MEFFNIKSGVKLLWQDIVDFVREDFNLYAYLYEALLLTGLIVWIYFFGGYQDFLRPMHISKYSALYVPLFYASVYFLAALPEMLIRGEWHLLKNKNFYLKALFFIAIYGIASGQTMYKSLFTDPTLTPIDRYYLRAVWIEMDGLFLVALPLFIYKYLFDKDIEGFYGLCRRTRHINVYLMALMFMLPFVIAASFLPDFQSYYPIFAADRVEGAFGQPLWLLAGGFEIFYGLDYLTTELFFRGALVIGMTAILGPRAVLPMCAMYCSIHFGKPILECISSIFGGYLLGILAYKTKHIWGGVCAHLGIAFMMEIMGLIHLFARM